MFLSLLQKETLSVNFCFLREMVVVGRWRWVTFGAGGGVDNRQGPTVPAVGAGGVCWTFLSSLSYFFLPPSG